MESLSDAVGKNIENLRLGHPDGKMSREKLAELVDVDATTIWRWEKGKSYPERKNIEAIAKVFRVDPAAITGRIELAAPTPPTISELARELTAVNDELAAVKAERDLLKKNAEILQQTKGLTPAQADLLKALNEDADFAESVAVSFAARYGRPLGAAKPKPNHE